MADSIQRARAVQGAPSAAVEREPVRKAGLGAGSLDTDRELFIGGYFSDRVRRGDRLDPVTGKIVNVANVSLPTGENK